MYRYHSRRQGRPVSWRCIYLFMAATVTRNKHERGKRKIAHGTARGSLSRRGSAATSAALSLDRGQRNRAIRGFAPLSRIRRFNSFIYRRIKNTQVPHQAPQKRIPYIPQRTTASTDMTFASRILGRIILAFAFGQCTGLPGASLLT